MKIGFGFDVHRLVPEARLVLAGVEINYPLGLSGHSDADVLAHAVADAILGAMGEGDLGTHFPSSDPRWRDAPGSALLEPICRRITESGLRIGNVDTTLIAQEPRLAAFRSDIEKGLARMLSLEPSRVNVKLKSADHLGSIGRGEGMAAYAVVLLIEQGA